MPNTEPPITENEIRIALADLQVAASWSGWYGEGRTDHILTLSRVQWEYIYRLVLLGGAAETEGETAVES